MSLFFRSGLGERLGVLDFPSLSHKTLAAQLGDLCAVGRPATFGRGGQTVLDPSYRNGLTLVRDNFALTEDVNSSALGLLPMIQNSLACGTLSAEPYHANVYLPGGVFHAHRDTPGINQIGSLVLSLPSTFSGGTLVVSSEACGSQSSTSRFSGHTSEVSGAVAIPWCAFFSDCKHWIEPVITGCRVTVTYRLLSSSKGQVTESSLTAPCTAELDAAVNGVREALADPSFLPHGGHVGVALQHGYPGTAWPDELHPDTTASGDELAEAAARMLKGSDAVLFQSLRGLSFSPKVYATVRFPDAAETDSDSEDEETREHSGALRLFALDPRRLPQICTDQINISDLQDIDLVVTQLGGKRLKVDSWVDLPQGSASPGLLASAFQEYYGNEEGSVESIYMSATLVATIPPYGQR